MAFSVVGTMAVASSTNAQSFTWPTHVAGDVAVAVHIGRANDGAVTKSSGPGTLFSAVESSNPASTRRRLSVVVATATTSSEAAIAFSDSGNMNCVGGIVLRGVTAPSAWLATTHGTDPAGGTSVAIPCGSPASGSVVLGIMGTNDDAAGADDIGTWSNANLSSVTEQLAGYGSAGAKAWIYLVTGTGAPGGAIADFTASQTAGCERTCGSLEFVLSGGTPAPTITDVDTDEIVLGAQTSVAVTGTNLGTTNADRDFELVQGSTEVLQTETGTGTTTAATLTIVTDQSGADIKYGSADLRITRDSDALDGDIAVTVLPPSGHLYVDVVTPHSDPDERISSTPDIESGDQIEARGVGGGAVPTGLNIYDDGTFDFDLGETPAAFDARVWAVDDSTWGSWATQSVPQTLTASGAPSTPKVTASGTAERVHPGSGATTTPAVTASGTAASGQVATGATTTPATTASGTAEVTNTASGATTTPATTAAGTAERAIPGSGATTAPATTASGTGTALGAGDASGAATTPSVTASGTAERSIGSTAVAFVPAVTASGIAIRGFTVTGACVTPAVTASGYDALPEPPPAPTGDSRGGGGSWGYSGRSVHWPKKKREEWEEYVLGLIRETYAPDETDSVAEAIEAIEAVAPTPADPKAVEAVVKALVPEAPAREIKAAIERDPIADDDDEFLAMIMKDIDLWL